MWLEEKTIPYGEDGINEKIMLPRVKCTWAKLMKGWDHTEDIL